jgi:transposase-like protein
MAVEGMRTCESVDELAKELGVTRQCLYKWHTKLEAAEPGPKVFVTIQGVIPKLESKLRVQIESIGS